MGSLALISYRPGKASPALFCLAAPVHVSPSSTSSVLPVIVLLPGQPKSGLANPNPVSIDVKKGTFIPLEISVHLATLNLPQG